MVTYGPACLRILAFPIDTGTSFTIYYLVRKPIPVIEWVFLWGTLAI
ncbi:MAG: hypothetical protein JSW35_02615 [Deltaproteobacteria bacterium]|nr:MAG: hypothetical protein JSW35_02615 [Deltaproteobacteria bacterium]